MYYINNFIIYGVFGYILESTTLLLMKSNHESGILYGPFTIVYGIGVILIIFLTNMVFSKKNWNKWIKRILLFLSVVITLSVIEFIGGFLIEKTFNVTFWDYSNYKFNLGKYVCIEMSIIWGILSFIFVYILKPLTDKLIKKIPHWLTYLSLLIFIIDLIFTLITKIRL